MSGRQKIATSENKLKINGTATRVAVEELQDPCMGNGGGMLNRGYVRSQ
jgi:hypothetical protein